MYRGGDGGAEPFVSFVAAARAAHREFAADHRAIRVNCAAGCIRVDRGAPAILALGEGFHAMSVAIDQPGRHVVFGHQYHGETAANGLAGRALHARIDTFRVGIGEIIHSSV